MKALFFVASLFLFSLPAIAALRVASRLARASKEEWRFLAWVPPVPLVLWAPWVAWDTARDRTSHNLWPFELVIWGSLTLLLFGAFLAARKLLVAKPQPWEHRDA